MVGLNPDAPADGAHTVYAAIYVRISRDKDGEGLGVARQEAECRRLCERLDWTVAEVFPDPDVSAFSGKHRPAYQQMLTGIRAGRITAVAAWHTDRLYRTLRELEDFVDLVDARGVQVQTVKSGEVDLSTAAGRMMVGQLGVIARYESDHRSERIRAKHAELAAAGKPSGGGLRPYGYRQIFDRDEKPHRLLREEKDPAEAAHIREWARRVLAGEDLSAVRRAINEAGLTTTAGNQWSNQTLARLLLSARISGRREHRPVTKDGKRPRVGRIAGKASWPAIISERDSDLLRKLLTNPERTKTTGTNGRYLLVGGVLVCGECGRPMVGRSRGAGRPRGYICNKQSKRGCGRVRVTAEPAEQVIVAMVAQVLASPEMRKAIERGTGGSDESDLITEIALCERELEQLAADHGHHRIERGEWMAARRPIVARRDAARARLSNANTMRVLDGVPLDTDLLAAFLLDESVEVTRRRAVVFTVLHRVVASRAEPGSKLFDPARLAPEWRA